MPKVFQKARKMPTSPKNVLLTVATVSALALAITNEPRFKGKRLLFLSGERRQESAARSKYAEMERHRTHMQSRHVDHWRMAID